MIQSTYTARSGLIAQQQRMDIIANNMANLSTTGYKSVRADFKDALYQTMVRPVQPQNGLNLERGHGVLLGATMRDYAQGTPQQTASALDLMLDGDGFFAVQDSDGETVYTRDGSFSLSIEDTSTFLVTTDGRYVLDKDGKPIDIKSTVTDNLAIKGDGTIWDTSNGFQIGQLGIHTFINRQGLEAVSGNCFQATDASGEAIASTATVRQGYLESSNVDLAGEMVNMIRAQRAFSLTARALTTADEMDSEANQIRR
ncbi:MAG: flagellar hook-basal body protein [Clostridia bacterium]|nr:flagellar hook-basal body protein [Clostridia bacterium]